MLGELFFFSLLFFFLGWVGNSFVIFFFLMSVLYLNPNSDAKLEM